MKILYLNQCTIPSYSAYSLHVMKMCNAFKKLGHEVKLFSMNFEKEVDHKNIFNFYDTDKIDLKKINVPKFYILRDLIYLIKIFLSVCIYKPDLILSRNLICSYIFSIFDFKIIHEIHSPYQNRLSNILFEKLLKKKNLLKLILISNELKKEIEVNFSTYNKILLLPDGSDQKKNIINKKQNIKFCIGYYGSLYQGRGIELIIQLSRRLKDINFVVYGGSKKELKKYQSKIYNKNILFFGHSNQKKLIQATKKIDIFIAPYQKNLNTRHGVNTKNYMSPLKIFDYMSFKKPMLVSKFKVLNEILTHRKNVMFCKSDNLYDWLKNINELKNNKFLFNKISNNALRDFQTKYTWKIRAKKILDAL